MLIELQEQGKKANKTGNELEKFIENILSGDGYRFIKNNDFKTIMENTALLFDDKVYTKQYPICEGIYGTTVRCDFIRFNPSKNNGFLAIEAKWQQTGGSVDEKYPYVVENIRKCYPCTCIIILDGGGYKPGAEIYLRSQVGSKLIGVYNMTEFRICANNGEL